MSSEKGRLSRWSRRKAEARARRGGAAPELEAEPEGQQPAVVNPDAMSSTSNSDTPPPDLPDVDTLTAESDFSQFMKEGVPAALRRVALRKLWASDPALTELDDMLEYGEDFTDGGALVAKLNEAAEQLKNDSEEPSESCREEPAQARDEVAEAEAESDVEEAVEEGDDTASGETTAT